MKICETFECWVKFCQIPYANFGTTRWFLYKFVSFFSSVEANSSIHFLAQKIYTFSRKEPIKMNILETFECSGQILLNSLCQFWNEKSIPLQILYRSSVSWKITPLYFFSSKNIYLAQKEPIKMIVLETYKCAGQNY